MRLTLLETWRRKLRSFRLLQWRVIVLDEGSMQMSKRRMQTVIPTSDLERKETRKNIGDRGSQTKGVIAEV
jgi:hypothetical protein